MMRCDVKNITCELSQSVDFTIWDFDVMHCYDVIFHTVRSNFRSHNYSIDNGVLVIDGKHIDRVATQKHPFIFDEMSYYTECRILARQECD